MKKNITLSIDEDVLVRARIAAAEQNTTVNAMVREFLTDVGARKDRVKQAMAELKHMSEKSALEVGTKTWTRDDLHER